MYGGLHKGYREIRSEKMSSAWRDRIPVPHVPLWARGFWCGMNQAFQADDCDEVGMGWLERGRGC